MYAVNRPFSQIITGPKQFVIPVFQRDYSWGPEQCRRMWSDIVNAMDHEDANHFLGSFVYVEHARGSAEEALSGSHDHLALRARGGVGRGLGDTGGRRCHQPERRSELVVGEGHGIGR